MIKDQNNERMSGCNYSFIIEEGLSSNGWLQLELRINSLLLKKGMTTKTCLKETQYPWEN